MSRVVEPTLGLTVRSPADTDTIASAIRLARREADLVEGLAAELRLASFRRYLQATVDGMSSLVPDVLALAGFDATRALDCVRPGHLWPGRVARRPQAGSAAAARRAVKAKSLGRTPATAWPLIARAGDAVIAEGLFGPWIEAAIVERSLEVVLRSEGFELSTRGGVADLRFAGRLPESVVALCPGRLLDEIVDHPLLRGRGYVVARAASHGDRFSVSFDVGRTGLVPPWAALAA